MALFYILAVILLICVIIAIIPVSAAALYDAQGLSAAVKILFFKINIYPQEDGKTSVKKPKKPPKPKEKRGGYVDMFIKLMPDIKKLLSKFRRKLKIKRLFVDFTAAGEDPSDTAIMYGRAQTALGIILPFLENNLNIKKREVNILADFTISKPVIYIDAVISIRIGSVIAVAAVFMIQFLKLEFRRRKNNQEVINYGKASDQ